MFKWKEPTTPGAKGDEGVYRTSSVTQTQKLNTLLKGSRLTGDITVSCDMELSGEVEGNITCEQNANIVIKGVCRGSIKTEEGNATIEGELNSGDIISGGDITVTGRFNGGKAMSKGRIKINGEFSGRLEGKEIEIGPNAKGKGELFYKEYISISKGAKIEAQINRVQEEVAPKKKAEMKVINMELPAKEAKAEKR
jgi:cytoskeletal protein CcmA (bactofilin family)